MSDTTFRDPGLQAERTLLSWQRTIVTFVVVALLYLRDPSQYSESVTGVAIAPVDRMLPIALLGALVAGIAVDLRRRWRRTDHGRRDRVTGAPPASVAPPRNMVLLSLAVVSLSVVVAATAVLG